MYQHEGSYCEYGMMWGKKGCFLGHLWQRLQSHDHSSFKYNSSVVIPRLSSMNRTVISGEPGVQRKLGPVSLQGEKKRGDRKEGR